MVPGYPEEKPTADLPLIAHSDTEIIILPSTTEPQNLKRESRKRRATVAFITFTILAVLYFLQIPGKPNSNTGCIGTQLFESERFFGLGEEWAAPPDVSITSCAQLIQDPSTPGDLLRGRLSSSTVFEFPLASEGLFLLARGPSAGVLNVFQSDDAGDSVKVHVSARYRYESVLNQVRVCEIRRDGGERGVGIFSPRPAWRDGSHYDVNILLPSNPGNSSLNIKSFETDLPLFVHKIGNLADTVHFDTISLKSLMMPISVGSLSATNARVETFGSKIEGTFYTSSVLELTTFDAPIRVNVGLTNVWNTPATRVNMNTRNAEIFARMSLISSARNGGQFKVTGITSKGPIDLTFTEAPVSSSLILNAQTSSAPASVRLHPAYEGEYKLATSTRQAAVSVDHTVVDPAGYGRKREVEVWQAGQSYASGSVSWWPQGKRLGSVNIENSAAPILLRI